MTMMATNHSPERIASQSEDSYGSDTASNKEEEKTIPFLRRLVDMLSENDRFISFCPGSIDQEHNVTLGRIVVHDRLKVEADVLPRYFNHSSFASLRRQLNYFSFTRLGKGRQRGATYCNTSVIEMEDILRLKRRSTTVGGATSPATTQPRASSLQQLQMPNRERSISCSSNSIDTNENAQTQHHSHNQKHSGPTLISPRSSPIHSLDVEDATEPQITLDLTAPPAVSPSSHHHAADILAGCQALLCFSKGVREIDV